MNIQDLCYEVTELVFDVPIGTPTSIIYAANRALREIYTRRIITKTARLYTRGFAPSYYRAEVHCDGESEITLPLSGKAFSMRLCGAGTYTIFDGDIINAYPFDTGLESRVIKYFIKNGGKIKLLGETSFSVYDFSLYSEIYSKKVGDIPDGGKWVSLDVRSIYGDFMSFVSPATDSSGNPIPSCSLSDGKIRLNSDYRGEIILTYRRLPQMLTNDPQDNIDIPDEYYHLLPTLTASYILLDADEKKAKYYRERYEEMLSRMESNCYQHINTEYKNLNGWA